MDSRRAFFTVAAALFLAWVVALIVMAATSAKKPADKSTPAASRDS